MAIVKMRSFYLLAPKSKKSELLLELQKMEDVHFKNSVADVSGDELQALGLSQSSSPEELSALEDELSKLRYCASKLEPFAAKRGMFEKLPELNLENYLGFAASYDYKALYDRIKACEEKIGAIKAQRVKVMADNEALKPWKPLDEDFEAFSALKTVTAFVGTVTRAALDAFRSEIRSVFESVYIESLGQIKESTALLVLAPSDMQAEVLEHMKGLGFTRQSLPFKGIPNELMAKNLKELDTLYAENEEAKKELSSMGKELPNVRIAADCLQSHISREKAAENFLKSDSVLLIEGWTPDAKYEAFEKNILGICGGECCLINEDVPQDSEDVPVKLSNNKMVGSFEALTAMYATPKYGEIDPTPFMVPFYILCFAFMLGDMGYGIVLAVGGFLAAKYLPAKKSQKQFYTFFGWLGVGTFLLGILFGGLFGFPVFTPITNPDGSQSPILDSAGQINNMLFLTVGIGIVQVMYGLGIKAYMLIRDKKPLDALMDGVLFIVLIISALVGFGGSMIGLDAGLAQIFVYVFVACPVLVAITQGRSSPSIGGKLGNGLYAVYGLSSYVGDFLSYSRLIALNLSGAYIIVSFIDMAEMMTNPFVYYTFGVIIIIAGNLLNLGLGALGAYVHSARLAYVEFMGKFFEGGGVPWKPLGLSREFVDIKGYE